jgi:hypothetical protein
MNIKTLSCVAVVTAALTVPAFAQYHHLRGHGYGPAHGTRTFRGAYNQLPANNAGREFTLGSAVCPGSARSFDCKIWPPPAYDDPDRRGAMADREADAALVLLGGKPVLCSFLQDNGESS